MSLLLFGVVMMNTLPINLTKVEEFYLRGFSPSWNKLEEPCGCRRAYDKSAQLANGVKEAYSSYFFTSLFTVSSKNHIITTFPRQNIIYCYDTGYNLIRSFGGIGEKPGKLLGDCLSLTLSQKDKITVTDKRGRISIFDDQGNFLRSFLIPDYRVVPIRAMVYQNFLIVQAKKSYYPRIKKVEDCIQIYNLETGKLCKEFFIPPINIINLTKEKEAWCLFTPYFTISQEGHIICNYSIQPEVYEYDLQGNLIYTYKEIPPHYIKLEKKEKEEVCRSPWVKDMLDINFSYSGWPILYGEDMFIIQRGTHSPIYLDFYSVKEKKYLGFCKTDKPLLFSTSRYIYLCEELNDTLLTVGKYKTMIGPPIKKDTTLPLRELTEVDIEKGVKEIPFREFKIRDLDGRDITLLSLLSKDKHHFIFFTRPRERMFFIYEDIKNFCDKAEKFDFLIVINHSNAEEAKLYYKGVDLGVPIIMNIEPKRVRNLGRGKLPFLLAVDINGNIQGVFNPYKEKRIKSLLEFLESVEKKCQNSLKAGD